MYNNKNLQIMKTYCVNLPKPSLKSIFGFLSLFFFASCGTYQNSSFYDTDGIYGSSDTRVRKQKTNDDSGIAYQSYFNSLQQENEVFTDVENYNSYDENSNSNTLSGNPGWGGNSQGININYFPNNFGMNWGLGWGMPFNNWGWGMPFNNWGWGMPLGYWNTMNFGWGYGGFGGFWGNGFNNWGWGMPFYGTSNFNSGYNYNPTRRGSSFSQNNPDRNNIGRSSSINTSDNYRGNFDRNNAYGTNRRNSINTETRTNFNQNSFQNRSNSNQSSRENNPTRTNSARPTRTSSPSNNEGYTPSRSMMESNSVNSGGSFGGSSSGGGGRSSGGGGRRGGR